LEAWNGVAKWNTGPSILSLLGSEHPKRTGRYLIVAKVLLILGIISVLTVIVRIIVGPANLTFLDGQYVYLMTNIRINREFSEKLATDKHVALVN